MVVLIPGEFKHQTRGLSGTFDDDKENDLTAFDGVVLPSNSSGRQIYEKFGLTCKFHFKPTQYSMSFGE